MKKYRSRSFYGGERYFCLFGIIVFLFQPLDSSEQMDDRQCEYRTDSTNRNITEKYGIIISEDQRVKNRICDKYDSKSGIQNA